MKPTTRLYVALAFLILAAVAYGLVNREVIKPQTTPTPTERARFLADALAADITKITISDNVKKLTFVTEVGKDSSWTLTKADTSKDTHLGVDQARIGNAVALLPAIIPTNSFSGVSNLADYGLDKPAYTLVVTIKGQDLTLQIGAQNPDQSEYYVLRSDSKDVFLIGNYNFSPFITFLTDPPYIQPTVNPNAILTPSATPTPTQAATSTPAITGTPPAVTGTTPSTQEATATPY